jgi:phosphomannomutase
VAVVLEKRCSPACTGAGWGRGSPQLVDAEGRLFNGDEILYLMVKERLSRVVFQPATSERSVVPGVVGTLMTNMAVELAQGPGCGTGSKWVTATC